MAAGKRAGTRVDYLQLNSPSSVVLFDTACKKYKKGETIRRKRRKKREVRFSEYLHLTFCNESLISLIGLISLDNAQWTGRSFLKFTAVKALAFQMVRHYFLFTQIKIRNSILSLKFPPTCER